MAIQTTDDFLVNRGGTSYKVAFSEIGTAVGTVGATETQITAGTFDLSSGNTFYCGAITVPNPTNPVAGQTGLIRLTAAPTGWGANFKFPGGTAPTISAFPAVIPFLVQDATTILMGSVTENIT